MDSRTVKTQTDLKFHNLSIVYDIMRSGERLTRVELAKRSGLSLSSITRIVATLSKFGMIKEETVLNPHRIGRPVLMLENCPSVCYCLCIDVAVGSCKVAIVDLAQRISAYREIKLDVGSSFEHLIDSVSDILPKLVSEARTTVDKVLCCGISVAGHVVAEDGIIANCDFYHWMNVSAKAIVEEKLGIPALVENDCKAALTAEASLLQQNCTQGSDVAYVAFNKDGVGCACMTNGVMLRGSRNAAGELGHVSAQMIDNIAQGEHIGYFESQISQNAVIQQAKKIDPELNTMDAITNALESDDARLVPLMDKLGLYIAIAVNLINCMYNPDTIILNGALIFSNGRYLEAMQRMLDQTIFHEIQPELDIYLSKLGGNASLYGIAAIAIEYAVLAMMQNISLIDNAKN